MYREAIGANDGNIMAAIMIAHMPTKPRNGNSEAIISP
jgi:hypothetical protein